MPLADRVDRRKKLLKHYSLPKCRKRRKLRRKRSNDEEAQEWKDMVGIGDVPLKGDQYSDEHIWKFSFSRAVFFVDWFAAHRHIETFLAACCGNVSHRAKPLAE